TPGAAAIHLTQQQAAGFRFLNVVQALAPSTSYNDAPLLRTATMPDYLLEIGTEELPAGHVSQAQERLKGLTAEALEQAGLTFDAITFLGTPRRLAVIVNGLAAVQATAEKKVKGPPVKSSFDADGNPLIQATK